MVFLLKLAPMILKTFHKPCFWNALAGVAFWSSRYQINQSGSVPVVLGHKFFK